jgi:predicted esterase
MTRYVVFSHGKESGPWGTKIVALAQVARQQGWQVESVDYQGIDDPAARVAKLLAAGPAFGAAPILVGSSMGGHVVAAASVALNAGGLFLMAPAFYMPGYEHMTPRPAACPIEIAHGWNDDVVPVENSFRWAKECRATLHVLATDHRMQDRLEDLCGLFHRFLAICGSVEA